MPIVIITRLALVVHFDMTIDGIAFIAAGVVLVTLSLYVTISSFVSFSSFRVAVMIGLRALASDSVSRRAIQ
jgi:hypothetical protein